MFDVSFSFMMLGYDEPTNNRAPRVPSIVSLSETAVVKIAVIVVGTFVFSLIRTHLQKFVKPTSFLAQRACKAVTHQLSYCN